MNIPGYVGAYDEKNALPDRPLIAAGLEGIEQVVVIPALAERYWLFATLASLARNSGKELHRTLVLCVINNRTAGVAPAEDIRNNQETIQWLQFLINGLDCNHAGSERSAADIAGIMRSPLRLAYIDASSPGWEMPVKSGGVGVARKIGLDAALRLFDYNLAGDRLLISLDADTLVASNYLSAIRSYFLREKVAAAVVSYAHQIPANARQRLAIGNYEIFLRYYVLGLRYAGSPFAFHSIGSAMICTVAAYVAVGGMNKRDAAEDFYFLNKLAKFTPMGSIGTTTVFPSARASRRVPFGTGRRVIRFMEGDKAEWELYDPYIFLILKRWLQAMKNSPDREAEEIMGTAMEIDPRLFSFLELNRFPAVWPRLRRNSRDRNGLLRQFHGWFDGFKTMKLVHFLTEHGLPQKAMFSALEGLLRLMGDHVQSEYHNPDSLR